MLKSRSSVLQAIGAVSLLWLGNIAGAALALLTQVLLARNLTAYNYGTLASGLATVSLLVPLAGFGVASFWLKAFGAEGWSAIRWLRPTLDFAAATTIIACLTLTAWATLGPHDKQTAFLLYWMLPLIPGYLIVELVSGKLQLEERYNTLAAWQLFPHMGRLFAVFGCFLFVGSGSRISCAVAAYNLIAFVALVVGLRQIVTMASGCLALKGHTRGPSFPPPHEPPVRLSIREVLSETWPFGLAGIFFVVQFQGNIVLISYLAGNEAAGAYNIAFIVMSAAYILPNVVYQKFLLPKIHRWANHDRRMFLEVYRKGNGNMLCVGLLAALIILVFAEWLVPLVFGPAYDSAVGVLMVLAFCAPVRFLATSVGATLVTQRHMRKKIAYMGFVALTNLALNIQLISSYGMIGAAVATLVSELTLLAIYLLAVRAYVFGPEAWRGWGVGSAKNG